MMNAEFQDRAYIVTVRGELDRSSQSDLKGVLDQFARDQREDQIKLDFSAVKFMDSTCGRLLSDSIANLKRSGQRIKLKLSPQVRRTLEFLSSAGLKSAGTTLAVT